MSDTGQRRAESLAIVIENAELRQQLAETHDQCVELAVDAGELHAENAELRAHLADAKQDRDRLAARGGGKSRV